MFFHQIIDLLIFFQIQLSRSVKALTFFSLVHCLLNKGLSKLTNYRFKLMLHFKIFPNFRKFDLNSLGGGMSCDFLNNCHTVAASFIIIIMLFLEWRKPPYFKRL